MGSVDNSYPGQYADQDIQIPVPTMAGGRTNSSLNRLVDRDLVWDEGMEGGRKEGWKGIGRRVGEEEENAAIRNHEVKITVDRGEGDYRFMGERKKMGFAQVVRETVLKEKGVSFYLKQYQP